MKHGMLTTLITFQIFYFVVAVNSSNRKSAGLRAVYDCACLGHNVIYECTVSGTGATIWRGEAFDCPDITLYFTNTNSTAGERECNNGAITGRLIHAQPEEGLYSSQLTVNVSSDTNGTNIECLYDSGSTATEIGSSVLTITEEPFPQLNQSDIHLELVEMDPNQLIFEWSEVSESYNCPYFHYRIMASNCGQCPNTTSNTTATCTGNFTQPANCSFSVQTVVCNNIIITEPTAFIWIEIGINGSSGCINGSSAPCGNSNSTVTISKENNSTENTNQDSMFIIIGAVVIALALLVGIALILGVALVYVIMTNKGLRGQAENTHTSPKPETNRTQDATIHDQDNAVYSLLQSTGFENGDNGGRAEAIVIYAEVGDHDNVRLQTPKPLDDDRVQYSEVVSQRETVCDQHYDHVHAFDSEPGTTEHTRSQQPYNTDGAIHDFTDDHSYITGNIEYVQPPELPPKRLHLSRESLDIKFQDPVSPCTTQVLN